MNTLRHEFLAHCAQCSPEPMLIEVERAEGVFLYSPNGKRYLDLVSGVSVSNVGHSNKQVVAAVQEQAARYMHTMVYGETVQRVQVEYAKLVTSLLGNKLDSLYFVNSGSEAIEGAIKLAKRATARTEIISMRGAYHGSSHGALSIQGGENYKTAFRPLLPDTRLIEFN
ncbi:MAG: aminotransferase class III-fold pyridoxal phosphate-dependent enzyme, partial [Mucinivorans sp.]